jgi:hypothetical protein
LAVVVVVDVIVADFSLAKSHRSAIINVIAICEGIAVVVETIVAIFWFGFGSASVATGPSNNQGQQQPQPK